MEFDNRCVVCRGQGRRYSGGVWQQCSVCGGRGYIQPISTFSFFKILYYLAGVVALCGLCGYFVFARGDRWWGPHTPPAAATVSPDVIQTMAVPERFQAFYDGLVRAGHGRDLDYLASKLDPSLFQIWTTDQCAASLRNRDYAEELPAGKIVRLEGPQVYTLSTAAGPGSPSVTADRAYVLWADLPAGPSNVIVAADHDSGLTWFTTCD